MICSQRIPILRLKWIAITSFIIVRAICPAISAMKVLLVRGRGRDRTGRRKGKSIDTFNEPLSSGISKFNPKFVHMTQCMKIIVNDMTAKRAMTKEKYTGLQSNAISGRSKKPTYVRGEK